MTTEVDSVPNPESSASGVIQDDKVAYSTYKRVLAEAKKFKELADSLSKQTQEEKEKQLKDQNEWKSLAEMHKAKLDAAQKELEEKNRAIQDGLKFSEFNRHLGGKLKHSSYANHVDFDRILINPETGMIEESSVKSVVADFIKQHSALVDFGNKPRLPNEAPRHGLPSGKKSLEEMNKDETAQYILEQAKLGLIK
jgi:CRISPR/Cas system CMR subunit Cmr6 (Cas7 group RAMP superfamily)